VLSATNSKGDGMTVIWKKFVTTIRAKKDRTTISFMNGDPEGDDCNGLDAVTLVPETLPATPLLRPLTASLSAPL
jgi:hypothetical protein